MKAPTRQTVNRLLRKLRTERERKLFLLGWSMGQFDAGDSVMYAIDKGIDKPGLKGTLTLLRFQVSGLVEEKRKELKL